MKLQATYVSVGEFDGQYFEVSFDREDPGADLDLSAPMKPYLLLQRQFEDYDGDVCYIETHEPDRYAGHFRLGEAGTGYHEMQTVRGDGTFEQWCGVRALLVRGSRLGLVKVRTTGRRNSRALPLCEGVRRLPILIGLCVFAERRDNGRSAKATRE